jgi:hypothetical protein
MATQGGANGFALNQELLNTMEVLSPNTEQKQVYFWEISWPFLYDAICVRPECGRRVRLLCPPFVFSYSVIHPTKTYLFAMQVYARLSATRLHVTVMVVHWILPFVVVVLVFCCLLNSLGVV